MKPDLTLQKRLLKSLGFSFLEEPLELSAPPPPQAATPAPRRRQQAPPPPPKPAEEKLPPFSSLPDLAPGERTAALGEIAREVAGCQRCILSRARRNPLPGSGPLDPTFALILEIPDPAQDESASYTAGQAGGLLGKIVEAIGSRLDECFVTFATKCHSLPFRPPHAPEVEACRPYLVRQMELLRPKTIVCFGPAGLGALLPSAVAGGPNASRGKVLEYRGVPLLMTLPLPAIVAHRSRKKTVWEDLQRLMAALQDQRSLE